MQQAKGQYFQGVDSYERTIIEGDKARFEPLQHYG